MCPKKIYIDTNLFILLVVGATRKDLIAKHRRLQRFDIKDYERLERVVTEIGHVSVTPNILTEASNILGERSEPEHSLISHKFISIIKEYEEVFVRSEAASYNRNFIRLGLTDAVLLEVVSRSSPLITVDLALYLEALKIDSAAAFNFTNFQSQLW